MSGAPAPYPADTRAKGWRFELDYESIMQSDTWALASEVPMCQPALLMMWLTAWAQTPCGSLPNDEMVIRAKCKIPVKDWAKLREVLMRGWWLADDGRLYHPTITKRVTEMLGCKQSERDRKAEYRARKEAERRLADANASKRDEFDGPDLSHGTNTGQTRTGHGKDDTGTGTGTGLYSSNPLPGPPVDNFSKHQKPEKPKTETRCEAVCALMRQAGMPLTNPTNSTLKTLVDAGASDEEFLCATRMAVDKGAGFAYALTVVANERKRAAELATQIHKGPMQSQTGQPLDPDSLGAIEAFAKKSGMGEWDRVGESWASFRDRLKAARGDAPVPAADAGIAGLVGAALRGEQ